MAVAKDSKHAMQKIHVSISAKNTAPANWLPIAVASDVIRVQKLGGVLPMAE